MSTLCVFAGSADGPPAHLRAAGALGHLVADRGHDIVYGGGCTGLMGAVADAALNREARVVGVVPRGLWPESLNHERLTETVAVETMHRRKAEMARRADAFLALPGGLGTLEELVEMLTWHRLGLHAKPVGLFDVDGYFEPLIGMLRRMRAAGYLQLNRLEELVHVSGRPDLLLDELGFTAISTASST